MAKMLCLTDMYWFFRIYSNCCIYSINSIYCIHIHTQTHTSHLSHTHSRKLIMDADNTRIGLSDKMSDVGTILTEEWDDASSNQHNIGVCVVCVSDMRIKAITQHN